MFAIRAPWARHPGSVACLAALAALLAAGCGSGDDSGGGNASAYGGGGSSSATRIEVASSDLGSILVGPSGRTLYLFEKDKGAKSSCSGACARQWPPLKASGAPKGGSGIDASLIGTTRRPDGGKQVTYNGHPLYYYAADAKRGDTKGQNLDAFGAEWYVLSPAGDKVERSGGTKDSGTGGAKPYSNY